MKSLHGFIEKEMCTGCTACLAICPKQCIQMEYDEEGFGYPIRGNECINCGLCEKVCPVLERKNRTTEHVKKSVYAAVSKDNYILEKSSSGGMFSEICKTLESDRTYVYGAYFDGLRVQHGFAGPGDDIAKFRKSKYVQSEMLNNFVRVKQQLEQGYNVIFSGTPCQVAGLKKYLNTDYDNLICVDFICHGVGSPKVFKYCMDMLGGEINPVVGYEFRHKKLKRGNYERYVCARTYRDGKQVIESNDVYMRLFLNQLCLRPSCSTNCQFRTCDRNSDITIADFNGFEEIFPQVKDNRTYSTIIINSIKGQRIFEQMKDRIDCYESCLADIERYNPLFCSQGEGNILRNTFFQDFIEGVDIIEKYAYKLDLTLGQKICRELPWEMKFYAKKMIRKIKTYGSK